MIGIENEDLRITVTQIAGILARRIVSWVTLNDGLSKGELYGMIRFGSCTEVVVPKNVELLVKKGDKVVGVKEYKDFVDGLADKLRSDKLDFIRLADDYEPEPYYVPLKVDGSPAKFLKAKPKTDASKCDQCGICYRVCPMSSISEDDYSDVVGICIKCQACIRKCPQGAKYFDDEDFLSHVAMVRENFTRRATNKFI